MKICENLSFKRNKFFRGEQLFDNSEIVRAAKNMEEDYQELIRIALTL